MLSLWSPLRNQLHHRRPRTARGEYHSVHVAYVFDVSKYVPPHAQRTVTGIKPGVYGGMPRTRDNVQEFGKAGTYIVLTAELTVQSLVPVVSLITQLVRGTGALCKMNVTSCRYLVRPVTTAHRHIRLIPSHKHETPKSINVSTTYPTTQKPGPSHPSHLQRTTSASLLLPHRSPAPPSIQVDTPTPDPP